MTDFELEKIREYLINYTDELLPENTLKNFVTSGSKMIRSKLAVLYLKANNRHLNTDLYKVLAAGEIIHNASLLHDDIIDNAPERRGNTTIGEKFNPKISILCGDYLVSKAVEMLLEINNSEILKIFNSCIQKMSKAEIEQYLQRGKLPEKEEYLKICEGKTAELFSAIIKSCAVLTDLDAKLAEKFAKKFGIYFQLKNDLSENSKSEDSKNGIYTTHDVLGIENTRYLLDNYKQEIFGLISEFPDKKYNNEIESLVKGI